MATFVTIGDREINTNDKEALKKAIANRFKDTKSNAKEVEEETVEEELVANDIEGVEDGTVGEIVEEENLPEKANRPKKKNKKNK